MDTSETTFELLNENMPDAGADVNRNKIDMTIDLITLETIIHELNELIIHGILMDFNEISAQFGKVTIGKFKHQPLIHIISPHGYRSLIYPMRYKGIINEYDFIVLEDSLLE